MLHRATSLQGVWHEERSTPEGQTLMKHSRSDYDRIQDPDGLIPIDEPVFLIRGQDSCGPETLRTWAEINRQSGGCPFLSHAADSHAIKMEEWQKLRNGKAADAPAGAKIRMMIKGKDAEYMLA